MADLEVENLKRAELERAEIRNNLRRQFQRKVHNPYVQGLIEDPAVLRWAQARANAYDYFKATPKTSILGVICIIGPPLGLYLLCSAERKRRFEQYEKGLRKRPHNLVNG
ncbi:NADH dehydrogenase [ubiquinone] 1 beta subcomplex subunit 4-like [Ptychodera flava]|uniref:NADH dehydrogenase [ubiquinone] 1 beta subcomplex subunit 4-like n=1 Tax=Ptychodera flava TaxID=63121 RepID=UPI00396A8A6F